MRIGFLSNQLDNRGTGNALYNYAHYNEEILGNQSSIYTFIHGNHDRDAYAKFEDRFGEVRFVPFSEPKIDVLYHIKSGYDDGFVPATFRLPYLVHAVFDNQPHGDRYATISPWMAERYNLPFVPHIVQIADTNENLREELGIPQDAIVFGRYGGTDSFDIPFVWDTIRDAANDFPRKYFLFMNTDRPDIPDYDNIIFLPPSVDDVYKRKFINTCDAMIHARARGETFGLAVGEFAIAGKPILTYSESGERNHLQELGHFALTYNDVKTLRYQMKRVTQDVLLTWGYGQYTPENVMKKFKEVFLD